jgi:hypothetical protein
MFTSLNQRNKQLLKEQKPDSGLWFEVTQVHLMIKMLLLNRLASLLIK